MTDTFAQILDVLATVTGEDTAALTRETDIADDLDLDFILFVQFLLSLEDVIPGLQFTQETLAEASFTTLGSLLDFVEAQRSPALAAE